MFGLVPKVIWSRLIPPNEHNGIPQNANVLLVELDDGRKGLIDTGCGNPERLDDKALAMNGMNRAWPLMDALNGLGVSPDSFSFIVLTHAHWDHAGGLFFMEANGATRPMFPNATLYLHQREWHDATSGDPLLYKSYPKEIIQPIHTLPNEQRVLVEEPEQEILPGIRLIRTSGHTAGHCAVWLESDQTMVINHPGADSFGSTNRLLFCGDVCPTSHHLRMVYQTGYDTFPLDTRAWKREWLKRAAEEDIPLFLCHDPENAAIRIVPDEKREFAVTARLPSLRP